MNAQYLEKRVKKLDDEDEAGGEAEERHQEQDQAQVQVRQPLQVQQEYTPLLALIHLNQLF